MSFAQVSDCESVPPPPQTPLRAAQMMRDKIVRRLSRPRARALEMPTLQCEMTKHLGRSRLQLADRLKQKNGLGGI